MSKKSEIKIGVRDLLEVIFNPKDLNTTFFPATRGQEGSEGHQILRSQRPAGYRSEVAVEFPYETPEYRLLVRGRIDGVLESDTGVLIEEIKTTYTPIADLYRGQNPIHEAQLKLYLYFVMAQSPGIEVTGKLTYLNLDDLSERSFPLDISMAEGEAFFLSLAEAYLAHQRSYDGWCRVRNDSLVNLWFPFTDPRPGQTELMDMVTLALEQERDLFAEAATGIGKTIAVLYPSLKRLADSNRFNQIFFLTAKTAGKEILKKTLLTIMKQGLRLRTVFIEAKSRVCLASEVKCHPLYCTYARDYYTKVKEIMPPILEKEMMTPELIINYAREHQVCPFELSLDLSLHADLIVCDYNYVFDPGVFLRRFFLNSGRKDFLFLVDEAHNLVPRGREMYSATLSQRELAGFRTETRALHESSLENLHEKIDAACAAIDSFFQGWYREIQQERRPGIILSHLPDLLLPALERLVALLELLLKQNSAPKARERTQEFYFNLTAFTRIAALVNKDYAIYVKQDEEPVREANPGSPSGTSEPAEPWIHLRLFCINPGPLLRPRLDQGRVAVFFSATLSPSDYFKELLGGSPDSFNLRLTSPFPQETRLYFHVPGIDTRYRLRSQSAGMLAQCISELVTAHTGNYLIFFPSYAYLQAVLPLVRPLLTGKAAIYMQSPSMSESQKQEFLRRITDTSAATATNRSNVGLAVLGGIFGEGIDLPGEQLVGVMVVGPGLPVVSDEQELIRQYFEERNGEGFLFAYLIPGLIRVIQAAGRVFRTPDDQGVVMLVDDRFLHENYQELLPPDWFMPGRPFSNPNYRQALSDFWND
jgi:DNA excision repair protein ERCC-2